MLDRTKDEILKAVADIEDVALRTFMKLEEDSTVYKTTADMLPQVLKAVRDYQYDHLETQYTFLDVMQAIDRAEYTFYRLWLTKENLKMGGN